MADPAAHERLAEALHGCRASVVLSGYPCELYDDLYGGWTQHRFRTSTSQAGRAGITDRIEVCWTNFRSVHLFSDPAAAA